MKQGRRAKKFMLPHFTDGYLSFDECRIGGFLKESIQLGCVS